MSTQIAQWKDPLASREDFHPAGLVLLDDEEMGQVNGGWSTSIPCAGFIVATVTSCFNDTVLFGSCKLGTRGCCR